MDQEHQLGEECMIDYNKYQDRPGKSDWGKKSGNQFRVLNHGAIFQRMNQGIVHLPVKEFIGPLRLGSPCIELSNLTQTPEMARFLTILGLEECLHQIPCHAGAYCPTSHAEDIHMIILDALLRGEMVMDQAGMDSFDLVGTDRSTNSASTDRDATLHLAVHHGTGQGNDIVGIIIVMVELMSAEIHDLVSGSLDLCHQLLLELKPSMISCKSYAHILFLFF